VGCLTTDYYITDDEWDIMSETEQEWAELTGGCTLCDTDRGFYPIIDYDMRTGVSNMACGEPEERDDDG
jgi:hypothetical protein